MAKKITFGKTTNDTEANNTSIEVVVDGELVGYLFPYRKYFFVIKSVDGRCTYGRSNNYRLHLSQYIEYPEKDLCIFHGFVLSAVLEYSNLLREICGEDVVLDLDTGCGSEFDMFINQARKYIRDYKD